MRPAINSVRRTDKLGWNLKSAKDGCHCCPASDLRELIMTLCDWYSRKSTLARRWKLEGLQMAVIASEGALSLSLPTSKPKSEAR
jgi:hypothetical protein